MPKNKSKLTRREFFRLTGATGLVSIAAPMQRPARASQPTEQKGLPLVPRRPFGNTGEMVSSLALGGSQDLMSKQMLLKQAFKLGVTYWDTAHSYEGGNSEKAIGKYFTKYPDDRKSVFLATKSSANSTQQLTENLHTSLRRMHTAYIDIFLIHHTSNPKADLTPEVRRWAEDAKARGMIRYFGFSTHTNMAQCLLDASKLGWIDGIMASYNYRLMNNSDMQRAVDACREAGIGLVAMKTQARFLSSFYADTGKKDAASEELADHFMAKGLTPEQAKLKAVWENPDIASICSEMPNMTILKANIAASADREKWSLQDEQQLRGYARATAFGYCAGCGRLCEPTTREKIPISDIMRCLMYAMAYGRHELAQRTFDDIVPASQRHLLISDVRKAEKKCPQHMPIGELLKTAHERFA
jgi:aryl-alcohol dehydrogenase-like predicted oxidoreductase